MPTSASRDVVYLRRPHQPRNNLFYKQIQKFIQAPSQKIFCPYTRFSHAQFCIFIQSECIIMHSTYQQPQAPSSLSTPSATRVNKHRRPCEQTIEVDVHKGNHTCSHDRKHLCTRTFPRSLLPITPCIYIQKCIRHNASPFGEIEKK